MEIKNLPEEFKEQTKSVSYGDETALDKLRRKGRMLIKNLGGQSSYLREFSSISFYPSFGPTSDSYKFECWEHGKNQSHESS